MKDVKRASCTDDLVALGGGPNGFEFGLLHLVATEAHVAQEVVLTCRLETG